MARLKRLKALAAEQSNQKLEDRVDALIEKEQQRFAKHMEKLTKKEPADGEAAAADTTKPAGAMGAADAKPESGSEAKKPAAAKSDAPSVAAKPAQPATPAQPAKPATPATQGGTE